MYFSLLRLLKVLVFAVAIFLFGLLPSYAYAETEELRPHSNNPILALVDGDPLFDPTAYKMAMDTRQRKRLRTGDRLMDITKQRIIQRKR